MKFIFACLNCIFICISAEAQQKLFSFPIPFLKVYEMSAISDQDGSVCYYFSLREKQYVFTMPATRDTFYRSMVLRSYEKNAPKVIATINSTDNFIFFYMDPYYDAIEGIERKYNNTMDALVVDKKNGQSKVIKNVDFKAPGNGKLVEIVSENNASYFIYSYGNNEQLGVMRFTDFNKSEFKLFDSGMPKTGNCFAFGAFGKIEYGLPNTISRVHFTEKVYVKNNNRLIFSFDISPEYDPCGSKDFGSTQLLTMDWNTGKLNYERIPDDLGKKMYRSNSFLYEDKLFHFSLYENEFNLSILNIENHEVVKKYHYLKSDSLTIQSNVFYVEGRKTVLKNDKRYIKNQKEIFRSFNEGFPAISIFPYQDSLLLASIGSFECPVEIPYKNPLNKAVSLQSAPFKANCFYFKTLINSKSCNISQQLYQPDSLDSVLDILYETHEFKKNGHIIYSSGNAFHLGYIDPESKVFNVIGFEK